MLDIRNVNLDTLHFISILNEISEKLKNGFFAYQNYQGSYREKDEVLLYNAEEDNRVILDWQPSRKYMDRWFPEVDHSHPAFNRDVFTYYDEDELVRGGRFTAVRGRVPFVRVGLESPYGINNYSWVEERWIKVTQDGWRMVTRE